MTDGRARVAEHASDTASSTKERGARSTPSAGPVPLLGSPARVARALAKHAGNAAAVRALGGGAASPGAARGQVETHAERAPIRRGPDDEVAVAPPENEVDRYRPAMLDTLHETEATQRETWQAARAYQGLFGRFVQAADPGTLEGVPPELDAKLQKARNEYNLLVQLGPSLQTRLDLEVAKADFEYQKCVNVIGISSGEEAKAWIMSLMKAEGLYYGAHQAIMDANEELAGDALELARIGKELEQAEYVQSVLAIADEAHAAYAANALERRDLAKLASRGTRHDQVSTGFAWGDVVNNSAAVVTTSIGLATTAAAAATAGLVSGVVGIVFAAIGTTLAIRAAWHATQQKRQIAAAEKYLSGDEAKNLAKYAKKQKATKQKRQAGLAGLGLTTVAVGTLGVLAAVGVIAATGGAAAIALAVAGLAVAIGGLSVGIWKYFHSKKKRSASAAEALKNELLAKKEQGDGEAIRIVDQINQGDPAKLEAWCRENVGQKRHQSAQQIVAMLVSDTPSDRFNAETLVEAIGEKPAEIRSVFQDEPEAAIGRVERKLASW